MKIRELHTAGAWLIGLSVIGLIAPLLSNLLSGVEGTLPWFVDLAANLQPFYVIGLFAGVLLAALSSWKYFGYLLFLLIPLFTAYDAAPRGSLNGESLKIITVNINFNNDDLAPLLSLIETEKPDLIALQEVSGSHIDELIGLQDYQFRQIHPDNSPFGMAVLSRLPFKSVVSDFNWTGSHLKIPTVQIVADWHGQLIQLISFHPMPPIAAEYHHTRNRKLVEIIKDSQDSGLPTVVAGDFNATPWSSAFADIGFNRATGLQPTWPKRYLGIPLDQVLVSDHWLVQRSEVGQDIGSDHLPVLVEIGMHNKTDFK